MLQFEIVHYGRDASESQTTEIISVASDSAARDYAGRLAIKIDGPVDLARDGPAPWHERYQSTAAPSTYHVKGYRFERLD